MECVKCKNEEGCRLLWVGRLGSPAVRGRGGQGGLGRGRGQVGLQWLKEALRTTCEGKSLSPQGRADHSYRTVI